MTTCEVCGKVKYDPKRKETEVRMCCDHPDAQRTCNACYLAGKGRHANHAGQRE